MRGGFQRQGQAPFVPQQLQQQSSQQRSQIPMQRQQQSQQMSAITPQMQQQMQAHHALQRQQQMQHQMRTNMNNNQQQRMQPSSTNMNQQQKQFNMRQVLQRPNTNDPRLQQMQQRMIHQQQQQQQRNVQMQIRNTQQQSLNTNPPNPSLTQPQIRPQNIQLQHQQPQQQQQQQPPPPQPQQYPSFISQYGQQYAPPPPAYVRGQQPHQYMYQQTYGHPPSFAPPAPIDTKKHFGGTNYVGYAVQPPAMHYDQSYAEYEYYDDDQYQYYPPSQTCKFYGSAVGCRNGDTCYYSHENPDSIEPCVEFQTQGTCKFEDKCHRRHAPSNDNKHENKSKNTDISGDTKYGTVCRYFSHDGKCAAGDHCRFKHTSTDANAIVPNPAITHCMYFNSSTGCKFGDKCRFLHPKESDAKSVVDVTVVEDEGVNGKESIAEHLMKKLNLGVVEVVDDDHHDDDDAQVDNDVVDVD